MPDTDEYSDTDEYECVEVTGRHGKIYRIEEDSGARARSGRRTSDEARTTNPRRQSVTTRPQGGAGRDDARIIRTPDRGPLLYQSSSPNTFSSPYSQDTASRRTMSTSASEYPGSSPLAPSVSEPRHRLTQSAFESKLSGLLKEFAKIESGNYKDCYTFVKKHPTIWKEDKKALLRDAGTALIASKDAHAMRCVQRAVMMQECTDSSPSKIKAFFEGLIDKKKSNLEEFLQDCSDAKAKLKAQIPSQVATTVEHIPRQDTNLGAALGGMSLQSGPAWDTGDQRSLDQFPGPAHRTLHDTSNQRETNNAYGRSAAAGGGRRRVASDIPTVVDSDGCMVETLDSRYKVRNPSAAFFIFGRVFATPWHTTLGANQANAVRNWVALDRFGGHILTHIQRMVVVKEGHGFSWCVPINTYQGRGVAKSGLNEADRLAHAIIYMEGTVAGQKPADENMMEKNPIAVHAAAPDQQLDVMSRINFGKVHTIEHNVKVMDVGKISRGDMDDFRDYWKKHK